MTDSLSEYEYFITNYKLEKTEYRKQPPENFKNYKYDWNKIKRECPSNDFTLAKFPAKIHQPLSALQVLFAETLKYSYLLNYAAEKDNTIDRLILIAAFSVSESHFMRLGRWYKSYDPLIGETYEYIIPELQILLISENV